MKILITGGGGFLGTYIIRELLKNPNYMVTNFSRHSYVHLEDLGVPTIKGDLRNPEDVKRALEFGFDAIFHVAALAGVWGKYEDFYSINFEGTKNILTLAKEAEVKKFIYTSTPSVVFGKGDLMGADETTPYAETHFTHYAETKTMAEKLVLESASDEFLTCAIRPHLIWGPEDPHLFPRVISRAKEGKLRIVGSGENLVDIVYVENAAMAHVKAFEALTPHKVNGEAYFIGQERPVNLWSFINEVLGILDIPLVNKYIDLSTAYYLGWFLELIFGLLGIRKPEPPMTRFVALNLAKSHYFSHEKARRDFGYVPRITIEEGLKRTFVSRRKIEKS